MIRSREGLSLWAGRGGLNGLEKAFSNAGGSPIKPIMSLHSE